MRFVACLVFIAAIAGACGLPDREEFARGSIDAGPSGDSGMPIGDAGSGPLDGKTPIDAGADAGFCPRTAVYCNDFSDGVPSLGGFTKTSPGVGSLTVVDGALVAKLDALPNKGYYETIAQYELPSAALKAVIEVDMKVSSAPWSGGNMVVLAFYYSGAPNNHAQELYIDQNVSTVTTSENNQLLYNGADIALLRDQWVHVKFDVDFTPQNGSVHVWYDGMLAISGEGIDFTPCADPAFVVALGMTRNNAPTPALTVLYDNLAVTLP